MLGVSNISFGLPQRPLISSAFFAMAMEAGLDAAIINPKDKAMMDAWRSAMVLLNRDHQAAAYIEAYRGEQAAGTSAHRWFPMRPLAIRERLAQAVINGDRDSIVALVEEAFSQGLTPMQVSNEGFLPGLEEVGRRFEKNIFFLPQVMQSADTMQAAFARLKQEMKGQPFESRGRILMATVEGDIHDIGKNIVCTLLENHGFEVFDLGKNVSAATIIAKAKEYRRRCRRPVGPDDHHHVRDGQCHQEAAWRRGQDLHHGRRSGRDPGIRRPYRRRPLCPGCHGGGGQNQAANWRHRLKPSNF